jgi:hypothetical protein
MSPGVACGVAVAAIITAMHNGQNWFLVRMEPRGNDTGAALTFAIGRAPIQGEPDRREYLRITVEERGGCP